MWDSGRHNLNTGVYSTPASVKEKRMPSFPKIEVFQELRVIGKGQPALRNNLIAALAEPWHRDEEVESRVFGATLREEEKMLAFRRESDAEVDAATVVLWPEGTTSYKVANVVPREKRALSEHEYNIVLNDLVAKVLRRVDVAVELSQPEESLLDWTSEASAAALWQFSAAANKSSAAGHPSDRERWMAFLVTEHQTGFGRLTPSRLAKWLGVAETWPEEVAERLASDFESALELLKYNDEHR